MRKNSTTIAKISRPRTSAIVPRAKLYDLLDTIRGTPLIFIKSPPGAGKTTLISDYIDKRKLPCLWYSIDEGDADIATFFYYMGMATQELIRMKNPLPLFSPDYIHGVPVFARRYFENLYGRVRKPFVIVFDNYHAVPLNSDFHTVISHGLENITEDITFIILSRKELPSQFIRVQTQEKMYMLGWDEIRFSKEESQTLVAMKQLADFTTENLDIVYEKTQGWIAGLVLILESFRSSKMNFEKIEKLPTGKIFHYFAHEVFLGLDKETKLFLLKTSFLPTLTPKMAEKITGLRNAEEILHALNENSYFTEKYFEKHSMYRYHVLFRDFLLQETKRIFSKAELTSLKQTAAELLDEEGKIEDAVKILMETCDTERFKELIKKNAASLIEQGRYQTLFMWLDFLSKEELSKDPWLIYWLGICRLAVNPEESLELFEKSFHQFRMNKDSSGVLLSWAGIMEAHIYGSKGLKPLDFWFPVIEEIMKECGGFPSEDIEAQVTACMVRALALRRPAYLNMRKWIDRTHVILEKTLDNKIKTPLLISLTYYAYSEGNFQELKTMIETLDTLLVSEKVSPLALLAICWLKAAYYNTTSDYDKCKKVVSEGIQITNDLGIDIMEYLLLGHGVLSSIKTGDFSTSAKYLKRMLSNAKAVKSWERAFYHYCAAWNALYQDDLATAIHHSDTCMEMSEDTGNPWTLSLACLLRANIFCESEEYDKAAKNILKAHAIGISSKHEFTPFLCLLMEAYIHVKQGKEEPALEAIQKAMRIGRKKGFVNLFMWGKGVLECIAAKALEHDIEVLYVKNLILKNALTPNTLYLNVEQWPWLLKIFTLGRFSIQKDELPIHSSKKAQHKPLLLLKALLSLGGRDVSEDRIVDILWQEADGNSAYSALTTTILRLRQFLDCEKIIHYHEGKITLNHHSCWVDIWAFQRISAQAEALLNENESNGIVAKEAERLAEKALKLYSGHFLPADERYFWTVSFRERLRNKFLHLITKFGKYFQEVDHCERAIEYYERALQVDDLSEEIYQNLMICYKKLEFNAEALRVYARCQRTLETVLGVQPSIKTESIYQSIKSP